MLGKREDSASEFANAWSSANADGIASLFVPDAGFVNVVGIWWTTREQIRDGHAYGFKHMFPNSVMILKKVTSRALGADYSVVHVECSMTGQITPAGMPADAHNTDIVSGAQIYVSANGTLRSESYK
ncbi:DUF4440 domain-containing protein [Arthrobacter sp. MYb227]|uniref:SgcJ/EcaC family oxidoreductase n=1 Tax=Arthrobacter sp. MYb227 TaxID=1848601 RepID=UPI000CFB169E|nr:SgcJ/EcaC family oxidoreductase [Arthrobacter sp. MYb227]PQZ94735.1 DUF4440 domain-containing protein [Arthrobacter sp. MYb227]